MPYIPKTNRPRIDVYLNELLKVLDESANPDGDVAYTIYRMLKRVYASSPKSYTKFRRSNIMDVWLEFWDREIKPYEKKKQLEHGDVGE